MRQNTSDSVPGPSSHAGLRNHFTPYSQLRGGNGRPGRFISLRLNHHFCSDIKDDQRSFRVSAVESLISFVQRSL